MDEKQTVRIVTTMRQHLKWRMADARYLVLGNLGLRVSRYAQREKFDTLQTFCCFVGHGRSGSTLVGAMLNAHPDIVISNELHALRRLQTGLTARQLYFVIDMVARRQARRSSQGGGGYKYQVPHQWQGKSRTPKVIGDRKAGATAYEILRNPQLLDLLDRKVNLDKKFIHVIRNPFDSIATTVRYANRSRAEDGDAHLTREISNYFARCAAVQLIEERFGAESICIASHERLVADPMGQLAAICRFLGVESTQDYLQDCASIVATEPHRSRNSLAWSDRHVAQVREGMSKLHWLDKYATRS